MVEKMDIEYAIIDRYIINILTNYINMVLRKNDKD